MADTYEKDLGQKSSLTVNDYIRVVGSDNVSYKQGVSNVAELMSNALPYATATEVLTWATGINGRGIVCTTTSTTDLPTEQATKYGVAWTYNYALGGNLWLNVFWSPTNRAEIYYNTKTGTNAWLGWQKMPTRSEVDTLINSQAGHYLDANNTVTITMSKYQCAGILYGAVKNNLGFEYAFGNGYLAPIKTATGVTVTLGSDYETITVTNSTTTNGWVGMLVTNGATVTMS